MQTVSARFEETEEKRGGRRWITIIKTRKEILEAHHDSALAKLLEDEINLKSLKQRAKGMKPGEDYDKLQEAITAKETNLKRIGIVLKIVEDMIKVEK